MFIKANGLWILLVYRQFCDAVVLDAELKKLSPQSFAPLRRGEEKHFQPSVLDAHKGDRGARLLFSDHQMGNAAEGLGDVFLDLFDLCVGKKLMGGADRRSQTVKRPSISAGVLVWASYTFMLVFP